MPKYKFALKNGKTLTLEGDTQPSDDEVEKIAKDQGVELQPVEEPTESISIKPEQYTQQPKTTTPDVTGEETNTEEPSSGWLGRAWHAISDPLTDLPSRVAKTAADYIDQPSLERSPMMARVAGFGAGALQGIGDLVSGATSPVNLATAALTGGTSLAEKQGFSGLGNLLRIGTRVASAPTAIHGVEEMLNPQSTLGERGRGLAELAGGIAAFKGGEALSKISTVEEETPKFTSAPPKSEGNVKFATKAEADVAKPKSSELPEGVTDPYAAYRQVPVGTKYTISPQNMSRKKLTDAIKLGFDYEGLNDEGKIIIRKTKPSQEPQFPEAPESKTNTATEILNLSRTLMASEDLSAPFRQGLGLIHKKAFWTNLPKMMKALGSEESYQALQDSILQDPIFQKIVRPDGKIKPSFAEESGLSLTNLKNMTSREESMMSGIAEKYIPGVRASNRAYTLFLNKVRADTFKQMTDDFGAYSGIGAKNNLPVAKQIAGFINDASGRGSLGPLEGKATELASVLFSPRLMASRIGMMTKAGGALFSPETYIFSQPSVRREYLKSLFAIAAASSTFTQLMRMAGAKVETDVASSDFGKPKIGNTRIDPYGGFQQYIVAAQRLMPHIDLSSLGLGKIGGEMKSTTTGQEYNLSNPKYGQSTRADVGLRFLRGKTNPIINFAWGLLAGQKELSGKSMQFGLNPDPRKAFGVFDNSVAQRFIPMLMQDVWDLYMSEKTPVPAKIGAGALAATGMGSQTYGNR